MWKGKKTEPVLPEDVVLDFDTIEDDEDHDEVGDQPSMQDLRLAARMCVVK
jgi:hypothetical protein